MKSVKPQTTASRILFALLAFWMTYLLTAEQLSPVPKRSELMMENGTITESWWQGIRNPSFLFRIDQSPLLFQVRQGLEPNGRSAVSGILHTGVQVSIGYQPGHTSLLGNRTSIELLTVNGKECYGPEAISAQVSKWRTMAFSISSLLVLFGLYNIYCIFAGRLSSEEKIIPPERDQIR